MYLSKNKKVFVFDWDGTIFDSMTVKRYLFEEAVSQYLMTIQHDHIIPEEEIVEIYIAHSGQPRFEIFQIISKKYGLGFTQEDFEKISKLLFEKVRRALPSMPIFKDAERFLQALMARNGLIFISSSVPQPELEFIVREKLPHEVLSHLQGIFGSLPNFTKGPKHIEKIKAMTNSPSESIIVFGDDLADYTLSKQAEVDCILLDREGKFSKSSFCHIPTFDHLQLS